MLTYFHTSNTVKLITVIIFFTVTPNSLAHSTLLDIQWCTNIDQGLSEVGRFQVDDQGISLILSRNRQSVKISDLDALGPFPGDDDIAQSDGQLDHDDYGLARAAAYLQCYDINPLARPIFYGPNEFLQDTTSASNINEDPLLLHHRAYKLVFGLDFGCYICRTQGNSDR